MKLLGLIFMKFCRFAFTYAMNKDCNHLMVRGTHGILMVPQHMLDALLNGALFSPPQIFHLPTPPTLTSRHRPHHSMAMALGTGSSRPRSSGRTI